MTTLDELVCEVLGVPEGELAGGFSRADNPEWTSRKHVELMVTVEEEYAVSFSSEEMARIRTVGNLRELLAVKGVSTTR